MTRVSRRLILPCLGALSVLLLVAACSTGGGKSTATSTTSAVVASPTAGHAVASPAASGSSVASPTAAVSPTISASPSPPAATATRSASPTATIIAEAPIGEIPPLDPEKIPNFSLELASVMSNVGGPGDVTVVYSIQQSAIDHFHLKTDGGGNSMEIWKVGDKSFIAQAGGDPAPLPEGTDMALFSPTTFLQVVPPIVTGSDAQDLGAEKIDGRSTRHYRMLAETFLKSSSFAANETINNPKGQIDVWVDDELRTPVRQQGEITWTNADGTDAHYKIDFKLTAIGSTPEIQPPATP